MRVIAPASCWPLLAATAAALALGVPGCAKAPAAARPTPPARCPSGYYEGRAANNAWAPFVELEVGLNLRCDAQGYGGDVLIGGGSSPVARGSMNGRRLQIAFGPGGGWSFDLSLEGARLRGGIAADGDTGTVELARVGDARPAPHLALTGDEWRQDLRFMARELPLRHKNAFHTTPRERFEAEVEALYRALPGLDGDGAFVGLNRIANLVGDGHTYLRTPPAPPTFPLQVRRFGDDYRVVAAGPEGRRALGARLVRVGQTPVAKARELLWPITSTGEHPWLREAQIDDLLRSGIALHGVGASPDRAAATFAFVDDAGAEFTVDLRATPPDARVSWAWAYEATPLSHERPDEPFVFTYLPASQAIYCNFRRYQDLARHAAELMRAVDERRPKRLVIDLRSNRGGDFTEGQKHLIEPIRRRPSVDVKGGLFVLIGTQTFSAAMSNASQFRALTRATLVGQPIGEKPTSYQEPREVKLPRSGLILRYSTRLYTFAEGGENVIRPDREIVPSWADFRAGRDPVLEWALGDKN